MQVSQARPESWKRSLKGLCRNSVAGLALTVTGSMVLSAPAEAQSGFGGPPWYNNLTIKYIYAGEVTTGNRFAFEVAPPSGGGRWLSTCGNGNEFYFDPTGPYYNQMVSIVMLAYAMGQTVDVYAPGQTCSTASPNWSNLVTDIAIGVTP
ncbi:MAG: hypothetical protein P4L83_21640 [Nevskia sp.]|nr:hypothetical protein [Nevskia sp.]